MQELIQSAMQQLGTSEDTTKSATGGLLNIIKDKLPQGDFPELLGKLPEDVPSPVESGGDSSLRYPTFRLSTTFS